jgi:Enoyl-CoA hydratase/isomerase
MTDRYNPLLARLLTFPSMFYYPGTILFIDHVLVPTIAAINGHCFAAGWMTALACDYRVMTDGSKRNAWMCMNEVRPFMSIPLAYIIYLLLGPLRCSLASLICCPIPRENRRPQSHSENSPGRAPFLTVRSTASRVCWPPREWRYQGYNGQSWGIGGPGFQRG